MTSFHSVNVRPVVFTPDFLYRNLISMPELFSDSSVTYDHIRILDGALSRLDYYPALLAITFTCDAKLIGSCPGSRSRLGFVAPALRGGDPSDLTTWMGREKFAHYLRAIVQEITTSDYDIHDPGCPRFKHFLHSTMVCVEMKRGGNLNPDRGMVAGIVSHQAAQRIDVFTLDDDDVSGTVPVLMPLHDGEVVIPDTEFDEMVFNSSCVGQKTKEI